MKKPHPNTRSVLIVNRITALSIQTVTLVAVCFGIDYWKSGWNVWGTWFLWGFMLLALYFICRCVVIIVEYRHAYYSFSEQQIYIQKGGWSTRIDCVPVKKVQHIAVSQSWSSRLFSLYSITFYTAGSTHWIGYIAKPEADEIKRCVFDVIEKYEAERGFRLA
ncbi:PH domain-containing protein [Paenibacillus alkalitolerans]|uniref:PH domain-containing protein n=1 Tax=Paenibacillus alkalitolerans TaxID=2799335 RepID=UPI0018F37DB1|nr:PH domain-containing protein [Paenibacillus alkalitolerans]